MAGDDDVKNDASSSSGGSGSGSGPRLPAREQQQQQRPAHEAPPAAPSGTGVNAATMAALQAQLAALTSQQRAAARPPPSAGQHQKEKYTFWETQPVAQFGAEGGEGEGEDAAPGPIDAPKTPDDIPSEPLPLPKGFFWCEVDVSLDAELGDVFDLLHKNYVEDDEEAFRFRYSPEFLKWALTPPGHLKEWHVGIRTDNAARRLVGFITAVPATLLVRGARSEEAGGAAASSSPPSSSSPIKASEVNFLCVHKKLRSRRLAPVLIREVTRRVNRRGVWHAAYTAGVLLPRPVATARYWHRSLDARKLVDVGFCRVPARVTMARYVKLHRLPEAPATPGLRPMRRADAPAVAALLAARMGRFALAPELSAAEVEHYLTPREGVVHSYVVEREVARGGGEGGGAGGGGGGAEEEEDGEEEVGGGVEDEDDDNGGKEAESSSTGDNATTATTAAAAAAAPSQSKKKRSNRKKKGSPATMTTTITDLVSFYTLPSTVVGGRGGHDTLTAAFSFYSVAGSVSPRQLAGDALVLARETGHDVFNALDIADNDQDEVLRALKFAPGDGRLRYYLYNWRMGGREELAAREIGLVLL